MRSKPNPLLVSNTDANQLETVYEDDYLLIVNKPAGMLSVPGKTGQASVLTILQERYPDATGPLLVHRLDMDTSGLLLAAKDKDIHAETKLDIQKRKEKERKEKEERKEQERKEQEQKKQEIYRVNTEKKVQLKVVGSINEEKPKQEEKPKKEEKPAMPQGADGGMGGMY